jgi:hypothetical protein
LPSPRTKRPPELGLIEAFFGRPWTWEARGWVMRLLAQHGYRFHIYAPKADPYLRRRWSEPHPRAEAEALAAFAADCKAHGVRFGVGLSPFEIYRDFGPAAREALTRKLGWLDDLGIQDLAILFDDMRGDVPNLARRQVEVAHFAAERTGADRVIVCPSYYSDDPLLDRVFGQRPDRYLESLGERLDLGIEVFWTGEEVCAREFSPGHLRRVGEQLRRKPMLWDNYPVNDGPRMSQHLHLRAFTGRPAAIGRLIAAHAINPALQAFLTCIPALTLAESYREGDAYAYGAAFLRAAEAVTGAKMAARLQEDLGALEDLGRDRLGRRVRAVRERYARFDTPAAGEVLAWLDGEDYAVAEEVQTQ